jgi:putative exosortase-associated protein (TIGR04073 family)
MMKRSCCRWLILLALTMAMVLSPRSVLRADDLTRSHTDASKMMYKLGRGVTNVLTGWIEVPKNIAEKWGRMDPFSGTVIGFFSGLGWGFGRTMTGFYEVLTFPLPIPEGYVPLMEPELVLTDIWGEPLPGVTEFESSREFPRATQYPRQ